MFYSEVFLPSKEHTPRDTAGTQQTKGINRSLCGEEVKKAAWMPLVSLLPSHNEFSLQNDSSWRMGVGNMLLTHQQPGL